VIHSVVLFLLVVSLNVAINSQNNGLLTLLISNQFVELKGSVFKKFEKENLFQITCNGKILQCFTHFKSDVVERFQIVTFLIAITLQNFCDLEWQFSEYWVSHMAIAVVTVWISEVKFYTRKFILASVWLIGSNMRSSQNSTISVQIPTTTSKSGLRTTL
jgi:hypothetical protein